MKHNLMFFKEKVKKSKKNFKKGLTKCKFWVILLSLDSNFKSLYNKQINQVYLTN